MSQYFLFNPPPPPPENIKKTRDVKEIPTPASNYMFKVSNRNTRTKYEICSKLTIKTAERRQA